MGGYNGSSGTINDSTLYLFDLTGEIVTSVVMANDDKTRAISQGSYLSNPSTSPGSLKNSPGSVIASPITSY